jgi:hypothetical protein
MTGWLKETNKEIKRSTQMVPPSIISLITYSLLSEIHRQHSRRISLPLCLPVYLIHTEIYLLGGQPSRRHRQVTFLHLFLVGWLNSNSLEKRREMRPNWELRNCCNHEQVVFLVTVSVCAVVILAVCSNLSVFTVA